jgi:hypothetical protein
MVARLCTNNYQMANVETGGTVTESPDNQTAYDELDMVGAEAIALRRKHPALQKAWDQYRTIWHLINENE